MDPRVDEFLAKKDKWHDEISALRNIALSCGLEETYKWKQPCYMHNGKNIAIVSSFKSHAFISFLKGALLSNHDKILKAPGENSQHARLIPVHNLSEIETLEASIRAYIFEAIEIEKQELKVVPKTVDDFEIPEELQAKFNEDPEFQSAFENLTPGRQKGYLLHFSQAKQSATRTNRILKFTNRILKGKGMNDCVCGHSKRMPNCDGSHKYFENS